MQTLTKTHSAFIQYAERDPHAADEVRLKG